MDDVELGQEGADDLANIVIATLLFKLFIHILATQETVLVICRGYNNYN